MSEGGEGKETAKREEDKRKEERMEERKEERKEERQIGMEEEQGGMNADETAKCV